MSRVCSDKCFWAPHIIFPVFSPVFFFPFTPSSVCLRLAMSLCAPTCCIRPRTWRASITPHVSGSLASSAQVTPSPIPCRQLFSEHPHTCPLLNPRVSIRGHTVAGDTHSLFPQGRPGCSLAYALPRVQEGPAFIPIGSSPLAVILCHVDEVGSGF